MARLKDDRASAVQSRILSLRYSSIVPERVEVFEDEGTDGEGVRIVVRFADHDGGDGWSAEDFLRLRREARDIAYDEYRILENLHLTYESTEEAADGGEADSHLDWQS